MVYLKTLLIAQIIQHRTIGWLVDESERIWKEAVLALSYYPRIYLEGLKKITKKSRTIRSQGQTLTREPTNMKQVCQPLDSNIQ